MNLSYYVEQLQINAQIIHQIVRDISQDKACWHPNPSNWSINEVINHLVDEEKLDFREHLNWIINRSSEPWTSIDPQNWVTEKDYNNRNFQLSLQSFLKERDCSLNWLRELHNLDFQSEAKAPWGKITAGDMLASWVAHDILHMRQLIEIKWELTKLNFAPYHIEYAGEW
jgi:hypothetical protein